MLNEVLAYLNGEDSYTAIEYLGQQDNSQEVLQVYNQLIKHFYYEEKNIQGLDAAKASFRLARELDMPTLRISRSHWLLGALQLASGNFEEAKNQFAEASILALDAGEPAEALLSDGFGILVTKITSPGDYNITAWLNEVKNKLSGMEDGQFFVDQLDTATKVFAG